jgi:hypothetical protein
VEEVLKYAFWDGSNWQMEFVQDGIDGGRQKIALDGFDNTHVCFTSRISPVSLVVMYGTRYNTGIEGEEISYAGPSMEPIYPNPSLGIANVRFNVPSDASVELSVYDLSGRIVIEKSGEYAAGSNIIHLNGLSTGVYVCRMTSGGFGATRRFVVIE